MSTNSLPNRKKTKYFRIPNQPGLCSIWDFNESKQKYIKREEGVRYYAYKKVGGLQKSKCFDSLAKAKKWRESPDLFEVADDEITFSEVMQKYFDQLATEVAVTTVEFYKTRAKHLWFFQKIQMCQINAKTIDAWLLEIRKPSYLSYQHKTRLTYKHELMLLRQVFKYYSEYLNDDFIIPLKQRHQKACIIDPQKYKEAKAKNQTRYIEREDANRFIQHLFADGQREPSKFLFAILALFQLRTGCRIGEACALRFEDFSQDFSQAQISRTVQWARMKGRETQISPLTKTGKARMVNLTHDLVQAVSFWGSLMSRTHGLVFSIDGQEVLPYRTIQQAYNRAFKALGLKWTSTHILRHSFATDFLEQTQNHLALQKMLGHANVKQTEHYAKITERLTEDTVRQYSQSLSESVVLPFRKPLGAPSKTQEEANSQQENLNAIWTQSPTKEV